MACLLSSVKSNLDKAAVYLSDARAGGVKVLTPDINRSVTDFAALNPAEVPPDVQLPPASPGAITIGLSAIRNVGVGLVELLLRRGADARRRNQRDLQAADFARLGGRDWLADRLELMTK